MLEPYADSAGWDTPPRSRGVAGDVERAARAGLSATVHAIGDAAVRMTLDALEAAGSAGLAIPHRIEHLQCVHPDDVGRAAAAGIVASMQPSHLLTDIGWRKTVGMERSRWPCLPQSGGCRDRAGLWIRRARGSRGSAGGLLRRHRPARPMATRRGVGTARNVCRASRFESLHRGSCSGGGRANRGKLAPGIERTSPLGRRPGDDGSRGAARRGGGGDRGWGRSRISCLRLQRICQATTVISIALWSGWPRPSWWLRQRGGHVKGERHSDFS